MSNFIAFFCQKCCPWLWPKSSPLSELQSKQGDNEDDSFMKQSIETVSTYSDNFQHNACSNTINQYAETPQAPTHHSGQTTPAPIKNQSKPSQQRYTQCIDQSHPYYQILRQKLELLPSIFNCQSLPEKKVPQTLYGLELFIRQTEDQKSNIFVYNFTFPTTFELYEEMQNNFELQKSFDNNIDIYECRDRVDDSTKVVYLSYKKVLIVSPRDFIYVRYQFKKGNQYWAVATSIPNEETYMGKIRGDIILTATRAIEKEGKLHLSVYSQIDMKMPIKASAAKSRGVTEIKKYLDKCYLHLESEKENIL